MSSDELMFWSEFNKRAESRLVAFRVSGEALEVIDRVARMMGLSRSELIRAALKEYLRSHAGIELDLGH